MESNESIQEELTELAEINGGKLFATLIFKYGFDGSGSHSRPMQPNSSGEQHHCKTLFASQLAPLQLLATVQGKEKIIYNCPRPNNPHSCRPIRLSFEAENSFSIDQEHSRLRAEIENLEPLTIQVEPEISISYRGLLTMVDGKVVSSLTNKNTLRCSGVNFIIILNSNFLVQKSVARFWEVGV